MVNDVLVVAVRLQMTLMIYRDDAVQRLCHRLTDLKLVETLWSIRWTMHSMLPLLMQPPTTHSLVPA